MRTERKTSHSQRHALLPAVQTLRRATSELRLQKDSFTIKATHSLKTTMPTALISHPETSMTLFLRSLIDAIVCTMNHIFICFKLKPKSWGQFGETAKNSNREKNFQRKSFNSCMKSYICQKEERICLAANSTTPAAWKDMDSKDRIPMRNRPQERLAYHQKNDFQSNQRPQRPLHPLR